MREFYAELQKLVDKGWIPYLDWRGRIRIKSARSKKRCCPITAVVLSKTKKFYPTSAWDTAGKKIRLYTESGRSIIDAADYLTWDESWRRSNSSTTNHQTIRRKLAAALGLNLQTKTT